MAFGLYVKAKAVGWLVYTLDDNVKQCIAFFIYSLINICAFNLAAAVYHEESTPQETRSRATAFHTLDIGTLHYFVLAEYFHRNNIVLLLVLVMEMMSLCD